MRHVWTHSSVKERSGRVNVQPRSETTGSLVRAGVKAGVGVLVLTAIAALPSQAGQAQADTAPPPRTESRLDAELANACIRAGHSKSECVCTVRTLRETVQALDYAPSVMLQTAAYSKSGDAVSAAKITLEKSGVSPSEIQALDIQRRTLIKTRIEPVCRNGAAGEPSHS